MMSYRVFSRTIITCRAPQENEITNCSETCSSRGGSFPLRHTSMLQGMLVVRALQPGHSITDEPSSDFPGTCEYNTASCTKPTNIRGFHCLTPCLSSSRDVACDPQKTNKSRIDSMPKQRMDRAGRPNTHTLKKKTKSVVPKHQRPLPIATTPTTSVNHVPPIYAVLPPPSSFPASESPAMTARPAPTVPPSLSPQRLDRSSSCPRPRRSPSSPSLRDPLVTEAACCASPSLTGFAVVPDMKSRPPPPPPPAIPFLDDIGTVVGKAPLPFVVPSSPALFVIPMPPRCAGYAAGTLPGCLTPAIPGGMNDDKELVPFLAGKPSTTSRPPPGSRFPDMGACCPAADDISPPVPPRRSSSSSRFGRRTMESGANPCEAAPRVPGKADDGPNASPSPNEPNAPPGSGPSENS